MRLLLLLRIISLSFALLLIYLLLSCSFSFSPFTLFYSFSLLFSFFFFFNDTATTEIYTLSLHDALPIYHLVCRLLLAQRKPTPSTPRWRCASRSTWHASAMASRG